MRSQRLILVGALIGIALVIGLARAFAGGDGESPLPIGDVSASALASSPKAAADSRTSRTYVATCSDSVYQAPPSRPPPTHAAVRLGPVILSDLAPARQVYRPRKGFPYYQVSSFFNVFTTAPRGVTVSVASRTGQLALIYGNVVTKPMNFLARLKNGTATLASGAHTVRFPLCHDPTSNARLITQYGLSVFLPKPGCFSIRVQPVGAQRRYTATVRVLVPRC